MKRKSGLLTFIFACIPGCGEMYQGYMKRGFSILAIFWVLIGISMSLNLDFFVAILPIIWIYSFFDSFNIHSMTDEEAIANPDAFLFFSSEDSGKFAVIAEKKGKIIGWALVAIGIYALYNTFVGDILDAAAEKFNFLWPLYNIMMYTIPQAVVIILIIMLGVWFIRGPKHTTADDGDFQSFTPPETKSEDSAAAAKNADCTSTDGSVITLPEKGDE